MIDPASSRAVLDILTPSIKAHRKACRRPFILGLSGLQGSGKSTWAADLRTCLIQWHGYNTRVLSIDDLYLDHDDLVTLRNEHPKNNLLRTRGQPGTHDEELARRFFDDLARDSSKLDTTKDGTEGSIPWPAYDKSLNGGRGGRVPQEQWERVPRDPPIDVLIFEGWCLGFQPLSGLEVSHKWNEALFIRREAPAHIAIPGTKLPVATMADHSLEVLLLINDKLRRYCETFLNPSLFDGFLHLDAEKLVNVYHWRIEQERELRRQKTGMSDDEVVEFVRGYMPSYELFLGRLQTESLFFDAYGEFTRKHIRVTLGDRRKVTSIMEQ